MNPLFAHGWAGLALAYACVQGPLVAGLIRGGAEVRKILTSPILAVPLTAAAGVGAAASSAVLAGSGWAAHGAVQAALGVAVSAAIGYSGGRAAAGRRGESGVHQRGAVVADSAPNPAASSAARQVQCSHARQRPLTLAGIPIPITDETKHFKFIGTTGTGKSTAIQEILGSALARGDRAVIADPDGGYLKRFYDRGRGDVVLNPFDERSVKWDLFAEIKNAYDVDQLARSLIPDQDAAERSWRGYARTFFSAVTRQAHEGGISDLGELYRLLVVADAAELRTLVKGTPAQPFLEDHNSRMFESIRSVTSSAVAALDYVGQQTGRGFSIRDWVNDESAGVLFIPYKAGQIAALRSTISAWMRLAIFETMNRDEPEGVPREAESGRTRLWFVVDELDALGQIDGLKDALARLRKFDGRCVLGFQSIAQVSGTYGHGEAHTIVENCGNTLILRCSASEGGGTARFASQLIGEREVKRTTISKSRRQTEFLGSISRTEHYSLEPAVLPSQIEQLPDLAGYLKHASDPQWRRVRLDAVRHWNAHRVGWPAAGDAAARGDAGRRGPGENTRD